MVSTTRWNGGCHTIRTPPFLHPRSQQGVTLRKQWDVAKKRGHWGTDLKTGNACPKFHLFRSVYSLLRRLYSGVACQVSCYSNTEGHIQLCTNHQTSWVWCHTEPSLRILLEVFFLEVSRLAVIGSSFIISRLSLSDYSGGYGGA